MSHDLSADPALPAAGAHPPAAIVVAADGLPWTAEDQANGGDPPAALPPPPPPPPPPAKRNPFAFHRIFHPVVVRERHDGWTAAKQTAFVAALAKAGCVRDAAAAVGMSTESAYRLRARGEDRRIAAGLADDSDAAAVARAAGDLAVAVTERDRYAAEVARAAALRDADDMREWHELQVARLAAARDGEAQLAVARTAVRAAEAAAAAAGVAGLDGDLADGDGTGAVTPDVARPSRTSGAAATRGPGGQGGALNRLGRRAARRRTARAARRRRRAAGRP